MMHRYCYAGQALTIRAIKLQLYSTRLELARTMCICVFSCSHTQFTRRWPTHTLILRHTAPSRLRMRLLGERARLSHTHPTRVVELADRRLPVGVSLREERREALHGNDSRDGEEGSSDLAHFAGHSHTFGGREPVIRKREQALAVRGSRALSPAPRMRRSRLKLARHSDLAFASMALHPLSSVRSGLPDLPSGRDLERKRPGAPAKIVHACMCVTPGASRRCWGRPAWKPCGPSRWTWKPCLGWRAARRLHWKPVAKKRNRRVYVRAMCVFACTRPRAHSSGSCEFAGLVCCG